MLWILVLGAILFWAPSPTITHRTNLKRGHTQIKPKPCNVNGVEGTCMFVYECIKTDGKHIGMCVDNFMFGSCCSHNITRNTILSHFQANNPNTLYSPSNLNSSPRPTSFSISPRPHAQQPSPSGSLKVRPSKPISFITRTTRKPPTTTHKLKSTTTTQKPVTIEKPWTNKPPQFVTAPTKHHLGPLHPSNSSTSSVVTQSLLVVPHSSSPYGNSSPSTTTSLSYVSAFDLVATSKPYHRENSTMTKTSLFIVNATKSSVSENDEGITITSFSTSKPLWEGSAANEISIPSKPFLLLSKPEYWNSGKPSSYISRPLQFSTEPTFITRPRPQSILLYRPKPTRKPVALLSEPTQTAPSPSSVVPTIISASAATTSVADPTTDISVEGSISQEPMKTVTSDYSSTASSNLISGASKYQYSGQCGIAALSPRPEMRIVGGKNAPFGGWPWQVSVRRTSFFGFSSTHRCGGAVINENWIATAGHCVDDLLTSQIRIRVGEYDFSSVLEPYPFVERAVSKKVVHPKYNFFTYEYDLALVRLDSPLEFQPHISPICLPASDDLLIGENATVTGWGRLSEGGTLPSVLQQVSVPIVSNDKCKSMFLRAGRHEFIPEIFLCAGYENGGQDSCQGDSGGPLQVKGKNGRYFLAGIISWGIGCAEANLPGVCTRISKFVPWILENVT